MKDKIIGVLCILGALGIIGISLDWRAALTLLVIIVVFGLLFKGVDLLLY